MISLLTTTPVEWSHRYGCHPDPPIYLPFHFSLTQEKDPKILELLSVSKGPLLATQWALHPFLKAMTKIQSSWIFRRSADHIEVAYIWILCACVFVCVCLLTLSTQVHRVQVGGQSWCSWSCWCLWSASTASSSEFWSPAPNHSGSTLKVHAVTNKVNWHKTNNINMHTNTKYLACYMHRHRFSTISLNNQVIGLSFL